MCIFTQYIALYYCIIYSTQNLDVLLPPKTAIPSLIHVDLWCNNIMYNDNEGEMVFLDFQFLSSGDPMWDLGVIVLLNTNLGLDKSSLAPSLQCYYETFYKNLDQLGAELPQETFDAFTKR